MTAKEFEDKERELIQKCNNLRIQIAVAEGQLQLLRELKPSENINVSITRELLTTPSVAIGDTFLKGIKELRQFRKDDLFSWVRNNFPHLEFSERSISRPLRLLMAKGEVVVLKPNQGSKTQAVYEYRPNGKMAGH